MDKKLEDFLNRDDCFFIHYASSGFYNGSSPAPKISCIILYNSKFDKTYTFNISDYLNRGINDTLDAECKLIYDFVGFIKSHPDMRLIHWNMNLEGFGFKAIRARAKELDIDLPAFLEDNLFDLSSYISYIAGKRLSIKQILWFNSLLYGNDYLDGKTEAEYFKKWRYDEICSSVKLKVKGFAEIANLIRENKLKIEPRYNDGLTREERRAEALKLAQVREKMIEEIYEHNRKVMEEGEVVECHEKEEVFFFDFAHPIVSLIAGWWGRG